MIYDVAVLERNSFVPTLYRVPVLGGATVEGSGSRFQRDRLFSRRLAVRFRAPQPGRTWRSLVCKHGRHRASQKSQWLKKPNGFSISGPSWSPDGKRIACGMFHGTALVTQRLLKVPIEGGVPQTLGLAKVGQRRTRALGGGRQRSDHGGAARVLIDRNADWFLPYSGGRGPAHHQRLEWLRRRQPRPDCGFRYDRHD